MTRVELPHDRVVANFTADSRLELSPELVGPCKVLLEGIVGQGVTFDTAVLEAVRPSEISYHLANHLMLKPFRQPGEPANMNLFYPLQRVTKRWLTECYLVCKGGTVPAMVTYKEIADQAAERIYLACQQSAAGGNRVRAILDPYPPIGSIPGPIRSMVEIKGFRAGDAQLKAATMPALWVPGG